MKIEKAREMREELAVNLRSTRTRACMDHQEDARLKDDARAHEQELKTITEKLRESGSKRDHSSQEAVAHCSKMSASSKASLPKCVDVALTSRAISAAPKVRCSDQCHSGSDRRRTACAPIRPRSR